MISRRLHGTDAAVPITSSRLHGNAGGRSRVLSAKRWEQRSRSRDICFYRRGFIVTIIPFEGQIVAATPASPALEIARRRRGRRAYGVRPIMPDFLPRRGAEFLAWSRNFDEKINAAAESYGLTVFDAAE